MDRLNLERRPPDPVLGTALARWRLLGKASGGARLRALAKTHGTPLYVHSAPLLAERVGALRAELPAGMRLLYSVKANPSPAVLGCLAPRIEGCDVTSLSEMAAAQQAGVPGERLSLSGPGKSDAELAAALACGARLIVESSGEAQRIARLAGPTPPRILLRLNPPFRLDSEASTSGGPRKFGVDSEAAPAVLEELKGLPLAFEGFHVYAGTRCLDAERIAVFQREIVRLAAELAPYAPAPVRCLDLGGGLGIPQFVGEAPLDLAAVGRALRGLAADTGRLLPDTRLELEPGRYLVGEAGLYLSRVVDRKVSRGHVFLIVDGGAHHHWHATGALEGRRHLHFPIAVIGGEGRPRERVTLCGPLCGPHDTWAVDLELAVAEPGDLIAVFQSGAYGACASPQGFLGKPPAGEVLADWP